MTIPDDDYFCDLERQRTAALVARDMATVARLHAADYELITPAGRVFTRAEYLAAIADGPFYAGWELGPVRVRASASCAVLRYQARLLFPSGRSVLCWHTDVYEPRDGHWQAVWPQATGIAAPTV